MRRLSGSGAISAARSSSGSSQARAAAIGAGKPVDVRDVLCHDLTEQACAAESTARAFGEVGTRPNDRYLARQLVEQPGLARAGRAADRHDDASAGCRRSERGTDQLELLLAPDERELAEVTPPSTLVTRHPARGSRSSRRWCSAVASGRGVDPQLVGQRPAVVVVDRQRCRTVARRRQGLHQHDDGDLAQRLCLGRTAGQLDCGLDVALVERSDGSPLERMLVAPEEPGAVVDCPVVVRLLRQRVALPQRQASRSLRRGGRPGASRRPRNRSVSTEHAGLPASV